MDKLVTLGLVERLRSDDFILKSEMAELNQNKNSKQPDRKLCFTMEMNR